MSEETSMASAEVQQQTLDLPSEGHAEPAPAPKRRGRPRKNPEPAEPAGAPAAEEPVAPKRRGRPRKVAEPVEAEETQPAEAVAPKRRGRPRKNPEPAEPAEAPAAEEPVAPKRRGRPRKVVAEADAATVPAEAAATPAAPLEEAETPAPKRRGRPRKNPLPEPVEEAVGSAAAEEAGDSAPKRRGRPRKAQEAPDEMTRATQEATQASAEVLPAPASTIAEAQIALPLDEPPAQDGTQRQHEAPRRSGQGQQPQQSPSAQQGQHQGRNKYRNRNRRGFLTEPTLSREELAEMKVAELKDKAVEVGVNPAGKRKAELAEEIYQAAARAEGFGTVSGVLEIARDGFAVVRTGNYMQGDSDSMVPQQLVKSLGLRPGDLIEGNVRPGRPQDRYSQVTFVETVNGLTPAQASRRPRFRDLTPIFPNERLAMETGRESVTGRAIDLVSPIGKGQRGLIVSPPKAGKTTVLKRICQSIAANNPEVHLFCLLVDERPEEVTDMQRSIKGTVVASTFDMPASNHTAVAELVIERAKRLVEMGEDVVVVLDSITRLARAYNLAMPASGRILSGGVDSAALYPPKKFLGAARNIEGGGSLTILASALVETGSKMDEVIFEEFKGTGNMELKLDRALADRRVFPAIDCVASGTRNEELLLEPEMQPFVWGIRRILANMNNIERSTSALIKGLKATDSNQEFLIRSAKKAQQSEFADAL